MGAWIGSRLADTSCRQIDWLCFYLWPPDRDALAINSFKLLLLPTLEWLMIVISGSYGKMRASFLIFSALPTASAAHVLAARYGADRGRVAVVVMRYAG